MRLVALAAALALLAAAEPTKLRATRRAAVVTPAPAADTPELLVTFQDSARIAEIEDSLRFAGVHTAEPRRFGARWAATLAAGANTDDALRTLTALPAVAAAERNGWVRAAFRPDDPYFARQ